MSKLKPMTALGQFSQSWDGVSLSELAEYELVNLSVAQGKEKAFEALFKVALKSPLPNPAQILPAEGGSSMWLEPGKYLVMLGHTDDRADEHFGDIFGETAYPVLLSDGWACLRIEGERTLDVFERFLPLDMRRAEPDFAARTSAHHIAVIIASLLDGSYLLLTPRSSAQSYLSALTHTIESVIETS